MKLGKAIFIRKAMNDSSNVQSEDKKKGQYLKLGRIKVPKFILTIGEKVLLLAILALAVFYFLPQISSLENSLSVLASLKSWALLLALATQLLSYYGSGLTISKCVNLSGKNISVFRGTLIFTASNSIGLIAGGMFGSTASIFRWIKTSGGDNEGSTLAASLPPVFVDIVLLFISIIGLIFLLLIHDLSKTQVYFFLIITFILVAICFLFIAAVRHKEKSISLMTSFLSGLYRIFKKEFPEGKFVEDVQHLFSTWDYLIEGGWVGPFLGSMMNILFDLLTVYFVFVAAGKTISPIVLIAGYGLPWLFGRMAFIFPGGVGIIESTMVAMYTSLGIDNSLVTVVVLTYRVISFWLPSILGFLILPFLNRITEAH
jgi:uncharacterized protein (TIRG00374 family)